IFRNRLCHILLERRFCPFLPTVTTSSTQRRVRRCFSHSFRVVCLVAESGCRQTLRLYLFPVLPACTQPRKSEPCVRTGRYFLPRVRPSFRYLHTVRHTTPIACRD